jgi:DNA-binding LacI/PurR family transcriptional regulator
MGKMAARLLLEAIAGQPQHHEIHRVPSTLVVRESSHS